MKLKSFFRATLVSTLCLVTSIHAANLIQVYYQAVANDPTFQEDQAQWLATEQNLPIARSSYLPQVIALGNAYRAYQKQLPDVFQTQVNTQGYYNNFQFSLTLTQPIFDAPVWHSIQVAKSEVKSAAATYLYDTQSLMVRTATAYFNVLKAYNALRFTLANKAAFYQQFITAKQQFKVGLIAVTGVYDAQSAYDQTIADEIENKNELNNRIEDLRAITSVHYLSLNGLKKQVPLIAPDPNNIYAWVNIAKSQNYSILAQQFAVLAADENIKLQKSNHLPIFNFEGEISQVRNTGYANSFNLGLNEAHVGVNVDFPIIQGGLVLAQTDQARYQYLQQSAKLVFTYRDVVSNTRQSFNGVVSLLNQIRADKQAIISTANALEATKAGYQVGTRTMTDVLNEYSNLYQAEQKYMDDQYDFILQIVSLKYAAGTLSVDDLEKINRWLTANIRFPKPATSYEPTSMPQREFFEPRPLVSEPQNFLNDKSFETLKAPGDTENIKQQILPGEAELSINPYVLDTARESFPSLPKSMTLPLMQNNDSKNTLHKTHKIVRYKIPAPIASKKLVLSTLPHPLKTHS